MLNIGSSIELIRDDIRVALCNIGEGINGDYSESDPEDVNLLRFDVYVCEDGEWVPEDDASYCTCISADAPDSELLRLLGVLTNRFYEALHDNHDVSVKKLGEELSWIEARKETETSDVTLTRGVE